MELDYHYVELHPTGSATTEVSKVKAFFIEISSFFMEISDHMLFTIEVHLVFCALFPKKEMENYEKSQKN